MRTHTEGQRLLRLVEKSDVKVANETGIDRLLISAWRNGKKRPGPERRRKLEELYGIAVRSWDQTPTVNERVVRNSDGTIRREQLDEVPDEAVGGLPYNAIKELQVKELGMFGSKACPLPTTRAGAEELVQSLRMTRQIPQISALEQVRLAVAETRVLSLLQRMDRDSNFTEDRIIRHHPKWRELRGAIVKALMPYPQAARAVIDQLNMIEDFEAAG